MDSRYFSTSDLLTLLAGLAVALVVGVLAGGALLRLSMRWLERARPGFARCCATFVLGCAFGSAANYALMTALTMFALVSGVPIHSDGGIVVMVAATLSGFVLTVLALAVAVRLLLRGADDARIAFPRALAVAGTALAMGAVLYAACLAVLLLTLGGVPGVSR